MPSSIGEQIRARMAVALSGNTPAGASVFRAREVSITRAVCPAIVIMAEKEEDKPFSTEIDEHLVTVNLEVFVRGDVWESLADAIATPLHKILLTDAPLAALVTRIRKTSSVWEAQEADRTAGVLTLGYTVRYLSSATDISATP